MKTFLLSMLRQLSFGAFKVSSKYLRILKSLTCLYIKNLSGDKIFLPRHFLL